MMGQVLTRPTGILLGFEISQNPFMGRPSWQQIEALPFAAKMQRLVRSGVPRPPDLAETIEDATLLRRVTSWDRIFPLGDPPDYEPPAEASIAARAAREGRNPAEVAYDMLLDKGGKAILYRPLSNYTYGTLDTVHKSAADLRNWWSTSETYQVDDLKGLAKHLGTHLPTAQGGVSLP